MLHAVIHAVLRQRLVILVVAVIGLAFGFNAASKLSVDAFPDVTNIQVQVATEVPGRSPDEVERIAVLVLGTETTVGMPFARKCYAHFTEEEPLPDVPKAEPRLAILREDARLARQAVLLAEADLLPSVGLTVCYGEFTQANLAREWGRAMTALDKLFFLEKIFGDFVVGRFFSPNVARLKDAMRRKVEAIVR